MFRGRHEHTVDEKGRLAIPTRFRDAIDRDADDNQVLVLTNFDKCLVAYPLREWLALEEKIMSLPQFDPRTISFQRFFVSGASECNLDKTGRILIPPTLRQYAGIDRDAVVLGSINKFEIWSKSRWTVEQESISANLTDFAASAAQYGIRL